MIRNTASAFSVLINFVIVIGLNQALAAIMLDSLDRGGRKYPH